MKVKPPSYFFFGFSLWYICYLAIPGILAAQDSERQVDVITLEPPKGLLSSQEKEIVDIREVAGNLHNQEVFLKASRVLRMVDNAYLSSGTVNLLTIALSEESEEVRIRAISLLGASRNRQAIDVISNQLQKDSSPRVRWSAAVNLGMLANEEAIPTLKVALAEDKRITPGVIFGLGRAGGTAVPILLQMLEGELKSKEIRNAFEIISSLESTGDRRIIEPLIDILSSRPFSPSESNSLRLAAAHALAHFATDFYYVGILKTRVKFSAVQIMSPRDIWKVKATDQTRIVDALKSVESDPDTAIQEFVRGALNEITIME